MKFMLITFFACLSLAASAQEQLTLVEGLGKLKVGKTTLAIIPELESEVKTKVKKVTSQDDVYKIHGKAIIELIPDTINRMHGPYDSSPCVSAKVYLLPTYKISDIEIKNLRLTFIDNSLAELECDATTELDDALKLKYGNGKEEHEEKDVPCTFTYTGNKVVYKALTYSNKWDSPGIQAYTTLSKYYDSNCKEGYLHFFLVRDLKASEKIRQCIIASVKRRDAQEEDKKKKKLSEL